MDMLLGIWAILFIVGLVPGSVFGYLLVKMTIADDLSAAIEPIRLQTYPKS